jgi:hypothetical protein
MIRITRSGISFSGSAEDLNRFRAVFRRKHYIRLPKIFDSQLLQTIQRKIDNAEFYERVHGQIDSNKEFCLQDHSTSVLLHFLLTNHEIFHWVQQITGSPRIEGFEGRVYRVVAGGGCHDAWHNDLADTRLCALSINLSSEVYSGGVLQMRLARSREMITEIPNTGLGDAILFKISPYLQHRISEMEGDVPKTAFAGWFLSQPNPTLL